MNLVQPPTLQIASIDFYDAPSRIEGSPYWVDLWASVNGYRIGLQVKPKTYKSASLSIYTGKAKSSQARGYLKFQKNFGGKVIVSVVEEGRLDNSSYDELIKEIEYLRNLPPGPHPDLP